MAKFSVKCSLESEIQLQCNALGLWGSPGHSYVGVLPYSLINNLSVSLPVCLFDEVEIIVVKAVNEIRSKGPKH